jgi:hypothetical protein
MQDPASDLHSPSTLERVFAMLLAIVLVPVLSFVIISDDVDLDDNKMRLAMVLVALLAGAVGATLPGLLNLRYSGRGLTIRALGGGSFFLVVLYLGMSVPGGGQPNRDEPYRPSIYTSGKCYAVAQCLVTKVIGEGSGFDQFSAKEAAIQRCYANGGRVCSAVASRCD